MMSFFYYIRRFWELPIIEKKLLVAGILIMLIIVPIFKMLPLKYYSSILKQKKGKRISEFEKLQIIIRTKKVINSIDRITSYNLNCFVKSAIFKILMNFSGIESKLELALNISKPFGIESHAYVVIDNHSIFLAKNGFTRVYTIE